MYSSTDILAAIESGDIFISGFDENRLGPNSYDLILGEYFFSVMWDETGPWFIGPMHHKIGTRVHLPRGGTLLAMTTEVIGTFGKVVGKMQARSTWGRVGVTVCRDAGLGDVGYHNHWTLEISGHVKVGEPFVIVGESIAQILFYETKTPPLRPYQGQYNKDDWPHAMIPNQWRHRVHSLDPFGQDP